MRGLHERTAKIPPVPARILTWAGGSDATCEAEPLPVEHGNGPIHTAPDGKISSANCRGQEGLSVGWRVSVGLRVHLTCCP